MLVDPCLESPRETRLVHRLHPPLYVGAVCLDANYVLRTVIEDLSEVFISFSVIDGNWSSPSLKQNLSVTFTFFWTKELDLADLKLIHTQDMSFSNPWRIHLAPGTAVVVTCDVIHQSSDCLVPVFLRGLRCSALVQLT